MKNIIFTKLILFLSSLISIIFGMGVGFFSFWYPLSYFKANEISSWIGMPITLLLTIIGTGIGATPFSYISRQRKNKTGYFGELQILIDKKDKI